MEEKQAVGISKERYRDLLIGTLYELREGSVDDYFDDACDTIGFTKEELKDLGFERS